MRIKYHLRKTVVIFFVVLGCVLGNLEVIFAQSLSSRPPALLESAVKQSLLSLIADLQAKVDRQAGGDQSAFYPQGQIDPRLKALGTPLTVSLSAPTPVLGLANFNARVVHRNGTSDWTLSARPDTAQITFYTFSISSFVPPPTVSQSSSKQIIGGDNSVFHSPGRLAEGGGFIIRGGDSGEPERQTSKRGEVIFSRESSRVDVGKTVEKGAHDAGRSFPKGNLDTTGAKPTPSIADAIKAQQPILFATNRKINDGPALQVASITTNRSREMRYGLAIVTVPKVHVIGNVERPKSRFLGYWVDKETDERHFRIKKLVSFSRKEFIDALGEDNNSILLFVHGYRVPFADAVFKAAQIAYDANFGGSVVVFSWPSAGALLKYDYDRESASFSTGHLFDLLKTMTQEVKKKKIYVVAHSLGNQIVVDALQQAALSNVPLNISELVMAAPDVDTDVYMSKAAQIKSVAGNITMYASSKDKALLASDKKAWGKRMGYIGDTGPNLVDGVEIIDVSAVGDDMFSLNHSTFSGNRSVLDDLGRLIISGVHPPGLRSPTLRFMPDRVNTKYWMYPQ